MQTLDDQISKGIANKRIDALLAQKIHAITSKFDSQLSLLLALRNDLSRYPTATYRAKFLALNASYLILSMLLDLWQHIDFDTLGLCIKELSFAKDSCQGFDVDPVSPSHLYVNHNVFFKLCCQPFYHSPTLFGLTLVPQILTLTYGSLGDGELSFEKRGFSNELVHSSEFIERARQRDYLNTSPKKAAKVKEYRFFFRPTKGGNSYSVIIRNKINGIQFGGIFITSDNQTSKSYFVKAYFGYPAKGGLNSEAAFTKTTTGITSCDIDGSAPENPYSQVNLKELFIYKVLDLIELGPKVHFMVNPYLKDGLFIITEDLNSQNYKFIEIGKLDMEIQVSIGRVLNHLRLGKINFDEYQSFRSVIRMLEIDTINRIFTLNDFNAGNIGLLQQVETEEDLEEEEDQDSLGKTWLQTDHTFKIIDFLPSIKTEDKYIVENIEMSFIEGNDVTVYDSQSIMYKAICRKIDNRERIFKRMTEEKKTTLKIKNVQEKLFFGTKVIESLDTRFRNDLESILMTSRQEIINFLATSANDIGLTPEYVKNGMNDIDMYIDGILANYQKLKDFIITEWQKIQEKH